MDDDRRAQREPTTGRVQPGSTEVESARLLANQARNPLAKAGLEDDQILRLADRFIARHLEHHDVDGFVEWALLQMPAE